MEAVSKLSSWNPTSQKVLAGVISAALIVLVTGIALIILKSSSVATALATTGGTLLTASVIYGIIVFIKKNSTSSSLFSQLNKEEMESVLFNLITETDDERKLAITTIDQLGINKTLEDTTRQTIYRRYHTQQAIIQYLIHAVPNLKSHLDNLKSIQINDSLTNYALQLNSLDRIKSVFILLDGEHRCLLLQKFITKPKTFLALLETEPTTSIELRKHDLPGLQAIADELLKHSNVKDVFYHVYASLSDNQQLSCLKCIVQERRFRTERIDMLIKTKGAEQHPIEFIEYALTNIKEFSGKIAPSFKTDTTQLFDALLPHLPALNIVTFYWRIAREQLSVWSMANGWTPKFQGTPEEKKFFTTLPFDQVARLNKTEQPWIAMWHPHEQPDDIIVKTCFDQLEKVEGSETVTQYCDTEYSSNGKRFKYNWDNFLFLLSFEQISMLICRDPQLAQLNQIFGFQRIYEDVPEKLLMQIHHWRRQTDFVISIPAVLDCWWDRVDNHVSPKEKISSLKELQIEEKYIAYFSHIHTEYEKIRPSVEASAKQFQTIYEQAKKDTKEWVESGKTWQQFFQDKHNESKRAAQEKANAAQAENERQAALNIPMEKIKTALITIGLNTAQQHSISDIRNVVKKILFNYHPDKNIGKSDEILKENALKYTTINNARDELLEALDQLKSDRTPIF